MNSNDSLFYQLDAQIVHEVGKEYLILGCTVNKI